MSKRDCHNLSLAQMVVEGTAVNATPNSGALERIMIQYVQKYNRWDEHSNKRKYYTTS
jgi:hypothetical protein